MLRKLPTGFVTIPIEYSREGIFKSCKSFLFCSLQNLAIGKIKFNILLCSVGTDWDGLLGKILFLCITLSLYLHFVALRENLLNISYFRINAFYFLSRHYTISPPKQCVKNQNYKMSPSGSSETSNKLHFRQQCISNHNNTKVQSCTQVLYKFTFMPQEMRIYYVIF